MHWLIPTPATATLSFSNSFTVHDRAQIVADTDDEDIARVAAFLANLIGNTVETTPVVVAEGAGEGPHIYMTLREGDPGLGDEGYELVIEPERVQLSAATPAGLFYGVQTIRQLLPWYVEYSAAFPQPLSLPTGQIRDVPRYPWRGAMLDVARHFLEPDEVKRFIDLMALYKLNRLHIHLTDDQGWRLEIPGRPRLTEIGAANEVGGGPGGFWTIDEYAEIVTYARGRFVTVVPEVDMPGHTNAALVSYPELTCDGVAPDAHTGTAVGFSYLCVEKEETYTFVEDVVREIAAVTPGAYFHLGGDEVHELTEDQYRTFMQRAFEIVGSHDLQVVGWDQIALTDLDLPQGSLVQVWQPQSRGTAWAFSRAAARGAKLILSPAEHIYLDMKYDAETVLGADWAGHNSVRDAYDWDPESLLPEVPVDAIAGVEAPLWSESLGRLADVEYMALPRLAGVAEIGWSSADARSWEDYRRRLAAHAPRWKAMGVNYYEAPSVDWLEPQK